MQRAEPDAGAGPGPQPGDRAPDCGGLCGDLAAYPLRLFDLLRGREHVLLLYGPGPALDGLAELTSAVRGFAPGRVGVCAILAETEPDRPASALVPVYRDGRGEFARLYGVREPAAFVVRPDGYLGARLCPPTAAGLLAHFSAVFGG